MVTLSRSAAAVAIVALGAAAPDELTGQLGIGTDVSVLSRYQWRGLTRRNAAVWQTDLFAAWRIGDTFLTVGGWTSVELSRAHAGAPDSIGLGHRIGEVDAWFEWSYFCPCNTLELGMGYTRYWFPRESVAAQLGSTVFNTGELYARAAARVLGFLNPRAAVWYDPEKVDGAYFEGGLALDVLVLPVFLPVARLGGTAGFSFGQEVDSLAPSRPAYFADDGMTHLELYVQLQLSLGIAGVPLYALPTFHWQYNRDDNVGRGAGKRFVWVGITISFQKLP